MIANSSHKGAGCGCGGATITIAQCSCGGAGCASCQGQGIVRPRFFAGQLLTEDDLQLLTDYVGHKNRLHNRYLFGAGVVCGLEVTCHPCADGRVIAHPGYALDCCGNDLTLACAATLDINAMIRDLRRDQLGGFDCVDPCPDPLTSTAESQNHEAPSGQTGATANPEGTGNQEPKPPANKYCLYIRYCEQETDPVTPYSTGEDCGRQRCEPTRVREGVKFELRCRPMGDAAHPLIQRLCACLGDLNKLQRAISAALSLRTITDTAFNTLATDETPFNELDINLLTQKAEILDKLLQRSAPQPVPVNLRGDTESISGSIGVTSSAETVERTEPIIPVRARIQPELIVPTSEVAKLVNRFNALSSNDQIELLKRPGLDESLRKARTGVEEVRKLSVVDSKTPFNEVRDWLIERLNNSPYLTDCTLRGRVFMLAIPTFDPQIGERGTRTLVGVNRPLLEAFLDFLRDCICRAFNPACEPCDDPGVLLACLEVEECKVVKICNLERSFVLSPAAVRYWLPPLKLLGNLAERLCCDPFESLLTTDQFKPVKRFDFAELLRQETERILRDSVCSPTDRLTLSLLVSRIGEVFQSDSFSRLVGASAVSPEAAAKPSPGPAVTADRGATNAAEAKAVGQAKEEEEREIGETKKKRPAGGPRPGQKGGKK